MAHIEEVATGNLTFEIRSRFAIAIVKALNSASIFKFALKLDLQLAADARKKGCPNCRGPLHSARYERKSRTSFPSEAPQNWNLFHSLCCATVGCRKRVRPLSVRFAGQSPHSGGSLLLFRVLKTGGSERSVTELCKLLKVTARTVGRWLRFWNAVHNRSIWWRKIAGRFALSGNELPHFLDELQKQGGITKAAELLLTESAELWAEIKISDGEAAPAKDA